MPPISHDSRQFGRRRALIHAFVVNDRGIRITCLVRNISVGGALLEVEDPRLVANEFRLVVEADGFEADCSVRHRTPHGVGVFFKDIRIAKNGRDTREAGPRLESVMSGKLIGDLAPAALYDR